MSRWNFHFGLYSTVQSFWFKAKIKNHFVSVHLFPLCPDSPIFAFLKMFSCSWLIPHLLGETHGSVQPRNPENHHSSCLINRSSSLGERGQALQCPLNHHSCHKKKFQVVFYSGKEQGHLVYCSLRGSFHQMVQKLFHNWAAESHWTLMFCFRNWDHLLIKNHGVYPLLCYQWGN